MGDSSNTASSAAATAMGAGYNDATVIRRRVKKEDEPEAEADNMYHDDKYNNKNGADNCNLNHHERVVLQAKVKKEEEGNNNKNDDHDRENEEASTTPKSINDNYDDWTQGNWCWLLPAATNNNTNHSVKSEEEEANDDTRNNARNPKGIMAAGRRHHQSKCSSSGTTGINDVAATSNAKRQRGRYRSMPHDNNGDDDNDNDNSNESKPPAKKKMKRHLSEHDSLKKKEADCVYDANNATHTKAKANDKYNDEGSTNNSNNGVDDGEGYESWTEGNWCLVLPFPAAITTTRRRGVRNQNSRKHPFTTPVGGIDDDNDDAYEDDGDNEYNKDSDNDDDNNAVSSTKSKKGKDTLGRCTSFNDKRWDENFQRLVAYKIEYNSTTVPYTYKVNGLDLGRWVRGQRENYRKESLSMERIRRLKSVNFVWKPNGSIPWIDRRWDEHFQRLVAYKKEYNSKTVPYTYKVNGLDLGRWVRGQRENYRNEELSIERMRRLNSVKFVWKPNGSIPWMEMYQKLVAYKTQHKSTNVPFKYKKDPKLGSWVNTQRWKFKNNELSEERINHLESISFVWSDVQWTAMYHKLAEYKRQHHGSTLVPLGYTEDPFLGRWVYNQRYAYNKGNLLGKRLKLLNAINFVWSLKNNASS